MARRGATAVLVLGIAAAGCATMSEQAKAVRQTKADEVASCHFISRIDAGAVPHSAASSLEVEAQKRDALEQAARAGATHVVWDQRQVAGRQLMTAAAYRCKPDAAATQATTPQSPAPAAAVPATIKDAR